MNLGSVLDLNPGFIAYPDSGDPDFKNLESDQSVNKLMGSIFN